MPEKFFSIQPTLALHTMLFLLHYSSYEFFPIIICEGKNNDLNWAWKIIFYYKFRIWKSCRSYRDIKFGPDERGYSSSYWHSMLLLIPYNPRSFLIYHYLSSHFSEKIMFSRKLNTYTRKYRNWLIVVIEEGRHFKSNNQRSLTRHCYIQSCIVASILR